MSDSIPKFPGNVENPALYNDNPYNAPEEPSSPCLWWIEAKETFGVNLPWDLRGLPLDVLRNFFGVYDWELRYVIGPTYDVEFECFNKYKRKPNTRVYPFPEQVYDKVLAIVP